MIALAVLNSMEPRLETPVQLFWQNRAKRMPRNHVAMDRSENPS